LHKDFYSVYLEHIMGEGVEYNIDSTPLRLMADVLLEVRGSRVGEMLVLELREASLEELSLLLRSHSGEDFASVLECDCDGSLSHTTSAAVN
jgi:hypothetical protein